jgi:hypothetical protein
MKKPLGIPRLRWESNIRISLMEVMWEGVYWIPGFMGLRGASGKPL